MDEQFSAFFLLPSCVVPGLACRANNFARGVYLCCKTEHKTQHEFLLKTNDFEVFME